MHVTRFARRRVAIGLVTLLVAGAWLLTAPSSVQAVPATSSGPAAAAAPVRVIAACTHPVSKPRHYVITCADAGIQLRKAQYQWWSHNTAHGRGVYYFNDCTPSCAGGHFHAQRAAFTLYRVVKTADYGQLFSRITIDTRQAHHVYSLQTSP
jgi:hypothetical protein